MIYYNENGYLRINQLEVLLDDRVFLFSQYIFVVCEENGVIGLW